MKYPAPPLPHISCLMFGMSHCTEGAEGQADIFNSAPRLLLVICLLHERGGSYLPQDLIMKM